MMATRLFLVFFCALYFCSLSAFALADSSPSVTPPPAEPDAALTGGDGSFKLDTVVVTGSLIPGDVRTIPANIQVIDREIIEKVGATDLLQVLERTTPVFLRQQPGNFVQFQMRGFGSGKSVGTTVGDSVLILIDGNRSGTGNPLNIPIDIVERIEILRGPASVIYGASAVGGVINLVTKQGMGKPSGTVGASAGRFDTYMARAGVSGGLQDDAVGYAVGGEWNAAGNYKTGRGDTYKNTGHNNGALGATVTVRPSDNTNISGVINWKKVYDTGSPGDYRYGLTPHDSIKNNYIYGSVGLDTRTDEGYYWKLSSYINQNRYFIDNESYGSDTDYRATTVGVRNIVGVPLTLGSGLDLGMFALGLEYANQKQELGGSAYYEPDFTIDSYSVFGEHKIELGPVTLQNGLRYDYYDMKAEGENSRQLTSKADSRNFHHVSWSSGLTWWLTDWLGLRGSVGTAYTPPTPVALTGDYTTHSAWGSYKTKGDPDLKAERSITYDAGVDIEYENLSAGIGYFYTRFKDRIGLEDVGSWPDIVSHYTNFDEQHLSGIEARLKYTHAFDVRGTELVVSPYATGEFITERYNKQGRTNSNHHMLQVPKYTALAGVGLGINPVWIDFNAQLYGDRYVSVKEKEKEFVLYNARVSVKPVEDLDVFFEVRNLENKDYYYNVEFPMPGRTFNVGFTYSF